MNFKKLAGAILVLGIILGGGYFATTSGIVSDIQTMTQSDDLTAGPTNTSITVAPPSSSSKQVAKLTRPEGISDDGVVHEGTLFQTHRETLEGATFIAKFSNTAKTSQGDTDRYTDVVRRGSNAVLMQTDYGGEEVSEWSNGSIAYKRGYGGDGTRIFTPRRPPAESELYFHNRVKGLVTSAQYTVSGTASLHGKPVFVLKSKSFTNPSGLGQVAYGSEITSFNATLYVSESGVIHLIQYRVESTGDMMSFVNSGMMSVTVNNTSVETPTWVQNAPEDAVKFNRSITDSAVVLRMTNGEPIPAGSKINVEGAGDKDYKTTLSQEIAPGDTVYITRSADGGLIVSVNERPSGDTKTFRRGFITITKDGLVYRTVFGYGRPAK